MTERRLPGGYNSAAANDFIQKGSDGLWYTRGAAEVVWPNEVVSVSNTFAMPARLGPVTTLEVDTAAGTWSDDTLTLCTDAQPGDIIRVIDVGGGAGTGANIVVLPGGAATIEGRTSYNLNTPFAMATFYRRSGHWVVLSGGQNVHTEESVSDSPITLGNNGAYVIGMDHLVRVITSSSEWPATGGTITLPTTNRRGARITICDFTGNSTFKEIIVSPGAGQINGETGSAGTLRFSNPYGSVTLENTSTAQWRIVACTAKYYLNITGAMTLQGAQFWHAIPVTVFVTGGFASSGNITLQTGAHVGAEVNICNVISGGGNGGNIHVVAASSGTINDTGGLSMTDYLEGAGNIYQTMGLRKIDEAANNWVIVSRANTIAV